MKQCYILGEESLRAVGNGPLPRGPPPPMAGELARQDGLDLPIIEQLAAAAKRLVKQKGQS